MEFTKFDFLVLVSMTLAVITMSFVFPALGLTSSDSANASDVPELDIQNDRFDLTGEFPERPTTPSSGLLELNSSKDSSFSDNQIWLEGTGTDGGVELVTIVNNSANKTKVTLRAYNDDTTIADNASFNTKDLGSLHELNVDDKNGEPWTVTLQLEALEDFGNGNYDYRYSFQVRERPGSSSGFLGTIPVVGSLLEGGNELASILAWIGSVVWFYIAVIYETAFNLIAVLFDITSFGFALLGWLAGAYASVVSGADGFATVFVAVPGLILSLEFAKIGAIGISLLPTT